MIGCIYKITHKGKSIVYVGSTPQTVEERWKCLKKKYKEWLKETSPARGVPIYEHFKKIGIDKFTIEAVGKHEVESVDQLLQVEQLVIDITEANRERINEKLECGCGGRYTLKQRSVHVKTIRHQLWETAQTAQAIRSARSTK